MLAEGKLVGWKRNGGGGLRAGCKVLCGCTCTLGTYLVLCLSLCGTRRTGALEVPVPCWRWRCGGRGSGSVPEVSLRAYRRHRWHARSTWYLGRCLAWRWARVPGTSGPRTVQSPYRPRRCSALGSLGGRWWGGRRWTPENPWENSDNEHDGLL